MYENKKSCTHNYEINNLRHTSVLLPYPQPVTPPPASLPNNVLPLNKYFEVNSRAYYYRISIHHKYCIAQN